MGQTPSGATNENVAGESATDHAPHQRTAMTISGPGERSPLRVDGHLATAIAEFAQQKRKKAYVANSLDEALTTTPFNVPSPRSLGPLVRNIALPAPHCARPCPSTYTRTPRVHRRTTHNTRIKFVVYHIGPVATSINRQNFSTHASNQLFEDHASTPLPI